MVEKSPRPKVRPQKIKESKPLAPEKSIRPKTREQVRVEDEMRQFGNLEFRADMEDQLSWNPLARLGFEPDQSVVGRPAYNSPHIYEGIRYPYDSEQEYIDETLPRAASGAEYRDIVGRVKPGSVIVNSNTAKNPVWSHEYTHGGLEKVMEYLDEDRDFFTEKYGEDTVRLLDEIRSDTDRSEGPNEKLTEMLDDVSKDLEVDLEGNLIPAAGTALGKMDNTRTAVEDWAASPTSRSMRSRRTLQEYLKLGRVKDEKLHKSDIESAFPGYVGIFEAAEDMLEAQGEPLPTEKRGWLKRTLSKMGFDEGGLADYRKRIVDMTEEELAEVAPSASNFSNVYGDRTDKPLSVQMGRLGLEFTPVGTVIGIDEIRQELQKEDPDYFKIGMMGGLEVLGLLPVLGDVAVSAIKAGAKKAGLNKSSNQIDNIPDGTKQIMAGPGARDYQGRALEKAAKMKSEGASAAEIEQMTGRVATAAPGSEFSAGFPNQYKFEIPDAEIKIENPVANYADRNGLTVQESLEQVTNKPDEGFSLESFIPSHSELFRQYPGIKNTIVSFTDKPGYVGFYDPSNNSINISTKLFERGVNSAGFRSTFFHELQHAAQAQDAIKTGMNFVANDGLESMKVLSGSRKDSYGKSLFETHLKDDKNLLNTRSELLALGEQILKNPNSKKLSEKLAYKYQQLQDEVYLNYLRYGKEVEARIAGERATGTKNRSVVQEKANQLPDRVEFGSRVNKPPNFLNRLSKALGKRPAKMNPKYLQKNIDGAMDFIASYNETEGSSLAKTMMKSLDNPEPNFAQGGAVDNMSMKKQMSLFEYGGIADDGMNKDPVSGNNVPPGSLAKEVRDDIPAMLSEGEYVVPADVLRYYGVNFFENLRGQAKQGLNTMEQNGRIGGTPMTQQDVARNMQQPMAPAPVQAAQGAMMQSPMRVQQQPAPQAMGNSGIPTQGYAGEDGSMVSRWSPARARYSSPMFQGTSSQQANIQTAQEQAATEEITQFRAHYNQAGETVQVRYVGDGLENMSVAPGQEELISNYPLTEEEWGAYKSEMSKNTGDGGGSGGGGGTTVSSGSDTSWMSGINFDSQADVKAWVDSAEGLGMSGLAKNMSGRGGIFGAIPQAIQAQDIAKVRGLAEIYKELNPELSKELTKKANDAVKNSGSLVISALEKLGLLSGDKYSNDPELQKRVQFGQETQTETAKILGSSGGSGDDDDPFVTPTVFEKGDVIGAGADGKDIVATQGGTKYTFTEDPEDDDSVFDDIDAQFEAAGVANNTGGLMVSTRSKKKKSKPKKTGLAGKK